MTGMNQRFDGVSSKMTPLEMNIVLARLYDPSAIFRTLVL
jgi:hypothetical protein